MPYGQIYDKYGTPHDEEDQLFFSHAKSKPCMKCDSPSTIIPVIYCLMAKQVTWVEITIKITSIPISHCLWMMILLESLLIWTICSAPTICCNMPKFVVVVALYLMHQRNKITLLPLKSNGVAMIISRRKRSFECRCSLIFSYLLLLFLVFLLLVLLLLIRFLDLLLVSLVFTFVFGIVCYRFLGLFFVVFTCVQTRLTLLKSKTRFIKWLSLDLKKTIQFHHSLLHLSFLSQGSHFRF